MSLLAGKAVLVTGGSRGLGRAIALGCAEAGADLALGGRNAADIEAVAGDVRQLGRRAVCLPADLADPAAIERMVSGAAEALGRLDVLINNAGIAGREAKAIDLTADDWDEVYRINLRAPALCAKAAARVMQGGVIVNIASISATVPLSRLAPYCSTKAALVQLTKVLAIELAPLGIRVNAVCPGYFTTPMNEEFFGDPKRREAVERASVLRRIGSPEELAPIVTLLASDSSSYMTGAAIVVDGGLTLRGG